MANPERVLGRRAYANYRNVRAVAVLFIVFGGILVLGGTQLAVAGPRPGPKDDIPRPAAAGMAVVGLAGVVGGAAALAGSRKWARLAYVMAGVYLLAIPIGTILGIVLLTGLGGYLDSAERLREAQAEAGDRRVRQGRATDE